MNITRTLDVKKATYDLTDLTDDEYNTLVIAYNHYMHYIRHCPPAEDDVMWNKMKKLSEEKVTRI